MNRSLLAYRGFLGSKRMWPKNNAATRSAAEQQELGCPLPAAVVAVIESIRNWLAKPAKLSSMLVFIISYDCTASRPKGKREKQRVRAVAKSSRCRQHVAGNAASGGFADGVQEVGAAVWTGWKFAVEKRGDVGRGGHRPGGLAVLQRPLVLRRFDLP